MLGTIINVFTVITGGLLGTLLKRSLPERFKKIVFEVIGLATLGLGVLMIIKMDNPIIVIISMVIGSLVGEFVNIEHGIDVFSNIVKAKLKVSDEKFSEGLVTAFITFCVGPMTILGSLQDGFGDPSILITKSILDGFTAIFYASAMGIGVAFSSILLFIYQGGLTVFAEFLKPFISESVLKNFTATGGIMMLGIGVRLLEIRRIRVANMLPALIIAPILTIFNLGVL
jgi:uncharacterized membrane protein YqgA involved in biofilm formation